MLLTSHNNEQALKANTLTLNSLATMVTSLMIKLESRTILNEPNTVVNNEGIHGSVPKSMCENQAQYCPAGIETSTTLPINVMDDTDHHSKDDNQPLVYTRLTRSKDAKLKGVTMSQENSQVDSKGRANEKAPKKGRSLITNTCLHAFTCYLYVELDCIIISTGMGYLFNNLNSSYL